MLFNVQTWTLKPFMLTCPTFVPAGVERSQEGDASDENEEAEFFDAMEVAPSFITVTTTGNIRHK